MTTWSEGPVAHLKLSELVKGAEMETVRSVTMQIAVQMAVGGPLPYPLLPTLNILRRRYGVEPINPLDLVPLHRAEV